MDKEPVLLRPVLDPGSSRSWVKLQGATRPDGALPVSRTPWKTRKKEAQAAEQHLGISAFGYQWLLSRVWESVIP